MGGLIAAVLGAAWLLSSVSSVVGTAAPGTVGYTFEKRRVKAQDYPHLARRQSSKTVQASLDNEILLYLINVTVGTPGQPFSLQLDTGSSDIWFPAVNADICEDNVQNCPLGMYDYSKSSTYSDPDAPEFQIQYVDGSQVAGAYISDVLNIGNTKLTNMTMAAALTANTRGLGIMGIGFESGEAGYLLNGFSYPNVISVLKNEGYINTLSYSLWLDDKNSNTGSILFGGVDTSKYLGDLVALPIQLDTQTGTISSMTVAWTGLTVTGPGQESDLSPSSPQPAILDSGTSYTLLPDEVAEAVFNGVGVLTDPSYGNVVPCKLANDDLTFSFRFGGSDGPVVNVSLSEFVSPLLTTDGSQPTFRNGDKACAFAIQAAGDNPILFGDSFLRSAYVVYDLENQEIGIGQTDFDAGKSNIQAFQASSGIPNAVSTASAASVAQTFSGVPHITQATATATGDLSAATSRSATFHLTATGTSKGGSSSSGSSTASSSGSHKTNGANANIRPAPFNAASILASCGVVVMGFFFGGSLVLV
ncbi:hypothetical protein HRR83_007287 [Exophiala dermatitidis]|uniref:Aspartic-type endopeptidase (OpsB) n=2 Tax=Exophiala dermatitidis TaxID=5970 RepID=H6C3Y2_EXODN|nr:aspartic-type endopeptidase (OpsB) [Exophiala dermatitidis NIH/UT8656]KAJ4509040.1 hypothetical protein HRR75_006009 [Exophiala dermatitidis]EHY58348.1 aspartic-type endopeptidase (OpsB) [Exophiala dermatitidis NIH/UT8656]KAJ4511245.1 hypothetical protein HRR73_006578 [Exophiala dermatitidis]KAJ4511819.1 hypothetical protein HRR74_006553 [Exophiala dermatitidis]KAJ4534675.1 hypothetical protein HRR76_006589 [Exophiala dermatitidis]